MSRRPVDITVAQLKDMLKDAALLGFEDDESKHDAIDVVAKGITDVRACGRCTSTHVDGSGADHRALFFFRGRKSAVRMITAGDALSGPH